MKKLSAIALGLSLTLVMVFVAAGCTNNDNNTTAASEVTNEPLATPYTSDGLTVLYPVSWSLNENLNGTAYIYPPHGGMLYVDTKQTNDVNYSATTTDSATLDKFYNDLYSSMSSGASHFFFETHTRKALGSTVSESGAFKATENGVDYEGYLYVALAGTKVYTVMVMVPLEYFPNQQQTLENIINSINITPPTSSSTGTGTNTGTGTTDQNSSTGTGTNSTGTGTSGSNPTGSGSTGTNTGSNPTGSGSTGTTTGNGSTGTGTSGQ
ncbi:MAG: hypothetical protein FWD72_00990 [Eggerthellaceae bacterium]|nr:hypothetical protein [Eggerthellaceae bacterium]